ncbi:MAG: D-glycero-D-manno-heptose 1,7-bisphosphate phosphatase [Gammaproteobacteria bacterium]|jgi:D-glycero-D-manno-heptose 1,7-bisphosphate phosphatase
MMKLIILDRDGVINFDSDDYIKSEDEWEAIPGSLDAIARLNRASFRIVVVSNQSGLARDKFTISDLNAIHRKMHTHLSQFGGKIEAVFFCPHAPDENCACRKPELGLFHEISRRLRVPLYRTTVVGDKLSDMQAALEVKAKAILVKTGYGQAALDAGELPEGIVVYDNLASVATSLINAG